MSGAAPLGASDEERFIQKFGEHLRIFQGIIKIQVKSQTTNNAAFYANTRKVIIRF